METDNILEMISIDKSFPGVHALKDVSFSLRAGEVHALLGENGAGKSTLINVLGGIYKSDSGSILINGNKTTIKSVKDARANGIAVIHQELVLVPEMSIAENIFLGREPKTRHNTVDRKAMVTQAQVILESVGLQISAKNSIKSLSIAQQQLIEISKALSLNAKILVMDEPTSSLSDAEVETLFTIINKLKTQGVGIIYVSHKMSELFAITDRITVMRDGAYIDTKTTKETDQDTLVFLMVGRELENYYTLTEKEPGKTALEVRNLNREKVFTDISFSVKEKEILGFAGLIGAGRSELMRAIIGLDRYDNGQVLLYGREEKKLTSTKSQKKGLVLVPEDRKSQGLVLGNTVLFNLTLAVLRKFIHAIFVDRKKERQISHEGFESLRIKAYGPQQTVGTLSGGNQQKVLIGKWLATDPKILILDEPTRGVDVGTKSEIYTIIDNIAAQGVAVILVSSELNEIMNMCDRVIVMAGGKIVGELDKADLSQESIMRLATSFESEDEA